MLYNTSTGRSAVVQRRGVMHVESLMKMPEFGEQDHAMGNGTMMVDSTVTSECGIQAASDTVCRGAQVTPLTRDAGCQYEDSPTAMMSRPLVPNIIKPSPIKHAHSTSPTSKDGDVQAMFMAAKALQQLHQRPVIKGCTALRPTGPSVLTNNKLNITPNGAFSRPTHFRNKTRGTQYTPATAYPQLTPHMTYPHLTVTHQKHQMVTPTSLVTPTPHKPVLTKPHQHPQSPTRTVAPLQPTSEAMLQSQIKALQSQALRDSRRKGDDVMDPVLLRSLGMRPDTESTGLMSLLQPSLMNTLPLTSYALLLDMLNRQAASTTNNSNIVNHLNQLHQLSKQRPFTGGPAPGGLLKPTVLGVGSTSTVLNSGLVTTPTSLTSSLFHTKSPLSSVGGILNTSTSFLRGSSPVLNVPTMLGKQDHIPFSNHKRAHSDSLVKREMDIESLVDSVIDEHMHTNKHDNNINNTNNHSYADHHLNTFGGAAQNCLFSRDILNEYEMTPPFKRRRRTVFTERQLQGLEEAYTRSQYLDRESRLELCKKLSLSLHTVVYWFQNKRAISRRRGQPLDNGSSNGSNNSSTENIHAYSAEAYKGYNSTHSSPTFKHTPPTSPNSEFDTYSTSPLKASMVASMVSPPSARPIMATMASPPSSMTNMSTTLTATSAIAKNVLSVTHMVGATI